MLKLPPLLKLCFSQSNYFHLCTFTISVNVSSQSPVLLLACIMSAAVLIGNGKIYFAEHRLFRRTDAWAQWDTAQLPPAGFDLALHWLSLVSPTREDCKVRKWTHHRRGFQLSQHCQQESRQCQSAFFLIPVMDTMFLFHFILCMSQQLKKKTLNLSWIYFGKWFSIPSRSIARVHSVASTRISSICWAGIL